MLAYVERELYSLLHPAKSETNSLSRDVNLLSILAIDFSGNRDHFPAVDRNPVRAKECSKRDINCHHLH